MSPEALSRGVAGNRKASTGERTMPESVSCPRCSKRLRVPDNLVGKAVTCPSCGKQFTAEPEAPPEGVEERPRPRRPAESEEEPAERPSRRRPPDEDDDEEEEERPRRRRREEDQDEDEDDRPRRRRPRDEEDDEDYDRPRRRRRGNRAQAEAAAKGPGIAFLIVGILGLLIGLLYVIQAIMGRTIFAPAQVQQTPPLALWVAAFVTLLWGAVVTLGGVKLMQLQSRGSVMVAAIFAMLPYNPCCLFGLPIGIWALVVLARPDVKAAFQ